MTIHRRTFVQAATALAVGAAGTRVAQAQAPAPAQLMPTAPAAAGTMTALPDLSSLDPKAPPPPKPDGVPAPTMKRFQEQRWVLDNIIRANGIDWDQPRLPGLAAALGPEATNDITAIRSRVQKFADITPAFSRHRTRATSSAPATTISWPRTIGEERSGPSTRTTTRISSSTRKSVSATSNTPRSPIIALSPLGLRSKGRPCRPGSIFRIDISPVNGCRAWSRSRAWTVTRSEAWRSRGIGFCHAGSPCW